MSPRLESYLSDLGELAVEVLTLLHRVQSCPAPGVLHLQLIAVQAGQLADP
ncbi:MULTISPECIES: hypothetical protein [Streptomyces]|uniref:hypothetical protein n=1 Tax=Streptomyces TaxID=1883 RepID=UPI00163C2A39|nr:hypothetical protein [Streptomyces sp. WAC00469]